MRPSQLFCGLETEPKEKAADGAHERQRPQKVDALQPVGYPLVLDFGWQFDIHFDGDEDEGKYKNGCLA